MRKAIQLTMMLMMTCGIASAQWGQPKDPRPDMGLKDAYKDYFSIGVAVNQRNVVTPEQMAFIQKEFNILGGVTYFMQEKTMLAGELITF